jgi:hypothetical protein
MDNFRITVCHTNCIYEERLVTYELGIGSRDTLAELKMKIQQMAKTKISILSAFTTDSIIVCRKNGPISDTRKMIRGMVKNREMLFVITMTRPVTRFPEVGDNETRMQNLDERIKSFNIATIHKNKIDAFAKNGFYYESVNSRIIRCYQCCETLDIDRLFFPIEIEHARIANCTHNKYFLTSDNGLNIPHEAVKRQFNPAFTNLLIKQLIRVSGLFGDLAGLLKNNTGVDDNPPEVISCVACMAKAPRILFLPCKHIAFCYECHQNEKRVASQIPLRGNREPEIKCPVCRTRVHYSTDIYLPNTKEVTA